MPHHTSARHTRLIAALATVAALALAGCSASGEGTGTDASGATIEHAFGETTVPAHPERVVTLGWGSADAALALGVVPAAIEAQSYGGDENGVLPWIAERVNELDAKVPEVVPSSSEEPAYEDIAAVRPDLILAPYSGITKEQYELLSDIAPTVAYPDKPWNTPWRDVVTIVGEALGKQSEAKSVLADIDATLKRTASEHPEFEGLTVAAVWDVAGTFYVYRPADARVGFLFDLGFTGAPAVENLANGDSTFYYTLSYERLGEIDSDVLVSFSDTEGEATAFLAKPYARAIPAVASGAVAAITGTQLVAAVSPPTALSLTWGLDAYVTALSEAAAHAR